MLIGGNGDGIFLRLMQAIGREDLAHDPQLGHNDGRARRAAELDATIDDWTRQRTVDEVIATLDAADVAEGKIYTAADIATDRAIPGAGNGGTDHQP